MKIIEIKDIIRKDVPIYYKRFYTGTLILDVLNKPEEIPVEFNIEQKPTGHVDINVTITKEIHYPLVPLMKDLKNYIGELDSGRRLPS